jgi:hypothetical protein
MAEKNSLKIDLSGAVFVAGVFVCIILFAGSPDLMDAILYRLTDGRIALPEAESRPAPHP